MVMKPGHALAVLFVAHLILASLLVSPGVLFGGEPISSLDYSLHLVRVWATDEMLSEHGRIWGYNPFFLAGYPAGTVFDVAESAGPEKTSSPSGTAPIWHW